MTNRRQESNRFGQGQQGHQTAEVETDSESDYRILEPESEMKMRLPRGVKTASPEKVNVISHTFSMKM